MRRQKCTKGKGMIVVMVVMFDFAGGGDYQKKASNLQVKKNWKSRHRTFCARIGEGAVHCHSRPDPCTLLHSN